MDIHIYIEYRALSLARSLALPRASSPSFRERYLHQHNDMPFINFKLATHFIGWKILFQLPVISNTDGRFAEIDTLLVIINISLITVIGQISHFDGVLYT